MNHMMSLVKRNSKIFYRTKGNIFFAMLMAVIILVLHFAVLQTMLTDEWVASMAQVPGLTADREDYKWIVDSLMFGGLIPLQAVSLALVTLGLMVADKEKNMLSDFLVSPIRRNSLLLSYIVSSFVIGLIILIGLVAFFEVYFLIVYGIGFTLVQFLLILLTTIGALVFANVLMLLVLSFLKTEQALGAVGSIVGVLMGFLGGVYMPIGMFGPVTRNVFSALPFLQLPALMRNVFLRELETVTPLTHEFFSGEIARFYGLEIWIGDQHIPTWGVVAMTSGFTLLLFAILSVRFAKMKKED